MGLVPGDLLTDLVLLMAVTIPVVVVVRRIHLPPLAGYLLVGVALGPHALGWIRAEAEIGVATARQFLAKLDQDAPRIYTGNDEQTP